MNLIDLGWNRYFEEQIHESLHDFTPARISSHNRGIYMLFMEPGEFRAELSGRVRYQASLTDEYPAVGDWVLTTRDLRGEQAIIRAILKRRTVVSRKSAGLHFSDQVIAANLDYVFAVTSLNHDLNFRRLERYLAMIWESGANPVVLLTKSDLVSDAAEFCNNVERIAPSVPVHAVSAITGEGINTIRSYLRRGKSAAFVGSSGVGKSTLINLLSGMDHQPVQPVRESDDRGRHTTTERQMFLLPDGGIVIDTPGMRELQLWNAGDGLSKTFEDIEVLSASCKFRNCAHNSEPSCAVRDAIYNGHLASDRLVSFRKLQAELKYAESKINVQTFQAKKRQIKHLTKAYKKSPRYRNR